jgi:hypothetical protein
MKECKKLIKTCLTNKVFSWPMSAENFTSFLTHEATSKQNGHANVKKKK